MEAPLDEGDGRILSSYTMAGGGGGGAAMALNPVCCGSHFNRTPLYNACVADHTYRCAGSRECNYCASREVATV